MCGRVQEARVSEGGMGCASSYNSANLRSVRPESRSEVDLAILIIAALDLKICGPDSVLD